VERIVTILKTILIWVLKILVALLEAGTQSLDEKPEKSEYTKYSEWQNGRWVEGHRDQYGNEIKDD
jgi:hypothetical protein